jgi:predicted ribosomally synthesized peptide with SipW-like signal peptide
MTEHTVSRRKVLAGLGTIGIASAGAGLGTTAFFSDEEAVSAELSAGRVDLLVDYRATYSTWLPQDATDAIVDGPAVPVPDADRTYLVGQSPDLRTAEGDAIAGADWARLTTDVLDACAIDRNSFADVQAQLDAAETGLRVYDGDEPDFLGVDGQPYADGVEPVVFSLNDVKPHDEGEATISLHVCDNPAYLYLGAERLVDEENGIVEPEAGDDDSEGELDDFLYVEVWHDDDCSNTHEAGEDYVFRGSLADLFAAALDRNDDGKGLRLTNGGELCFQGLSCLGFRWVLPSSPAEFASLASASANNMAMELVGKYDQFDSIADIDVNLAQTDRLSFGLTFYAEQCRHNMLAAGVQSPLDLSTGAAHAPWRVVDVPGTDASVEGALAVDTAPHPRYASVPGGCAAWIDPYGNGEAVSDPVGEYVYEVEFEAPDLASGMYSTLEIGAIGADNSVTLELDGDVLFAYDTYNPIDVVPRYVDVDAGTHTLRARVVNDPGRTPTGNPTALVLCATLY